MTVGGHTDIMSDRHRGRLERIDRAGGKLVSRLFGTILLLAVLAIGVPMLIGSLRQGEWTGAAVVGAASIAALALVRYLFSPERRLSDIE